jgi:hypothetical protein
MADSFEDLGFQPVAAIDSNDIGFVPESKEEQAKRLEAEKYDSPTLAAAAAAARGLSFGATDVLARGVGLDDELSKLKEYNPKSSFAGETAGAIGSAFVGPGALLAKGALGVSKGLGGGVLAKAAGAAIEGAGYGAGTAASEIALRKDLTSEDVAETILTDVGIGALTGGVVSLGVSGIGAGAKKAGGQLKKLISKATPEAELVVNPSDTLFERVVSKESPKAGDVRNAAASLGIDAENLPKSLTNDSELVRRGESYLSDNTTLAGQRTKAKFTKLAASLEDASKIGVLDDQLAPSVIQTPEQVKKNLVDIIEERIKPFEEGYARFDEIAGGAEISQKARSQVAQNIRNIDDVLVNKKSAAASKAFEYADALEGIETVGQLSKLRTQVGNDIRAITGSLAEKDYTKLNTLRSVYDKMTTMRESWIEKAVKEIPGGAEVAKQTLEELRTLNSGYAQTKKFISDLGESLGLSKVSSASDLAAKLDRVNDQQVLNRIFNTKDKASLTFLKDNLPEVYQSLSNNYKANIFQKSLVKGEFSLKQFVNEVKKTGLSPEMQDLVFGANQASNFRNIKTIVDRIPEKLFKGSAEFLSYRGLFDIPATIVNNMSDEALYAAINMAPRVEKAIKSQDKVINGTFKNFFEGAKQLDKVATVAGIFALNQDHEKKMDELAEIATNPEKLAEVVSQNTQGLVEADSDVQFAVADSTMKAVAFLQSKMPKRPIQDNIFGKTPYRPSDSELSKFNRYIKAIDAPLSILNDFQSRVLQPESVEAVSAIYPKLYEKIKKQAFDAASKEGRKISYQDKLQLAILLQMPVDASMSPESIRSLQQMHPNAMKSDSEVKASVPGMKNLNLAQTTATQTQRTLMR